LTEAAHGCLKPPPTEWLRRAYLHLSYSITLARLLDTTSHTTVHAGPHTAVRRVELCVNSQAFCIVRRQETIRSLPGRPSGFHPYLPPEGQTILVFCRVASLRSHCLLVFPFTPLTGYRSGLQSSFPAWPILLAPPFGFGVPQYPRRLHDLLCPLLTSTARSG
jgi:hypothetical protein